MMDEQIARNKILLAQIKLILELGESGKLTMEDIINKMRELLGPQK